MGRSAEGSRARCPEPPRGRLDRLFLLPLASDPDAQAQMAQVRELYTRDEPDPTGMSAASFLVRHSAPVEAATVCKPLPPVGHSGSGMIASTPSTASSWLREGA
jgi:hypothetical protein